MKDLSVFIAFAAGLASFFSPCVFPLVPSYILYMAGITVKDYEEEKDRGKVVKLTVVNSILFVFGFSAVFVLLGTAASLAGQILFRYRDIIRVIGGITIILMGLYLTGAFKLPLLDIERRFNLKTRPTGYLGSLILGVTFAVAWTPCAGPILGSILVLAGAAQTVASGIALLTVYSLGLAIPFLLTSIFINSAMVYFKKIEKYLKAIMVLSGTVLIATGALLLTNQLNSIITYLVFWRK